MNYQDLCTENKPRVVINTEGKSFGLMFIFIVNIITL